MLFRSLDPLKSGGWELTVGQQTGAGSNGLTVVVSAADQATVTAAAEALQAALRGHPDLTNLASDLVKATPEIQVRVDPSRAVAAGLTPAQVGATIRGILTPTTLGRISVGGAESVPLIVRLDSSKINSVAEIGRAHV